MTRCAYDPETEKAKARKSACIHGLLLPPLVWCSDANRNLLRP